MRGGDGSETVLAERLDALFRTCLPGGRRWTNDEAAAAIKEANPAVKVSGAYLSALRTGKRTRPSPELQVALAQFFGVAPSYFFDPDQARRVDTQLTALKALRETGARAVALRAAGLSPDSLQAITAVLDQIRRLQGLPLVDDEPES